MNMESGKKSVEELTTAGVFHIPDYQRYYSWEQPEWSDLWTDLSTLPEGKQHYFGTIIIQKTDKTETAQDPSGFGGDHEEDIHLLIDGQQRLTSLTLLVKSIAECLEGIAPQTEHEEAIQEEADDMEEFLVDRNVYLLKLLDEKDSEFLERILDGRQLHAPERPSQRKMIETKEYFDKCLTDFQDDSGSDLVEVASDLKQLWETIKNLELMVYVVDADNPEKATLIFDSVNDRGRALSTFDKTKSFLMRMAYLAAEDEDDAQQTIHRIRQAFGQMYDDHQRMLDSPYINDISDDAVQRYHFITFHEWSERKDHQTPTFLDILKSHIRELRLENPEACLQYIIQYTDSLESAFDDLADVLSHQEDQKIGDLIDRIHRLRHAQKFYPVLLKAWEGLDRDGRYDLLDAIETYIVRVYAIGTHPTYTGRSAIQRLARDTDWEAPVDDWVGGVVATMDEYENDAQFRRTLATSDLYTSVTSQDLRYLFYFYNEHRAMQEGEPGAISLADAMGENYTIEHIWPQSPRSLPLDSDATGEYPSATERYEAYKHRLGNLTLASKSWNSKWGNRDFQTKRDEGYENSKLWVQSEIRDYETWSIENIEKREETLKDFVMEKWATPPTKFSDITDPEDIIALLDEQDRYVLQSLCDTPQGGPRRVIHDAAGKLADSPFENPNSNGPERRSVGTILSRLKRVGLADRTKATWYPTDKATAAEIPL